MGKAQKFIIGVFTIILVTLGISIFAQPDTLLSLIWLFNQHYISIPSFSQSGWKMYIDPKELYSFKYPPSWKLTTKQSDNDTGIPSVDLHFTEGSQQYYMEFSNNFLSLPLVSIQTEHAYYWGRSFDRSKTYGDTCTTTFSCYLWIIPDPTWTEPHFPFEKIYILLPPTNTNKDVATFDQILSTFKFRSL